MAQRENDNPAISQILELARKLSITELEQLLDALEFEWERAGLTMASEQLARGEGIPGEQVFAELMARNDSFRKAKKKR